MQTKPNEIIETAPFRDRLAELFEAGENIDIGTALEQSGKLLTQIIALTKSIRETEMYNRKLIVEQRADEPGRSLEARLRGYAPSTEELKQLRTELKEHLKILGPRLFEDEEG